MINDAMNFLLEFARHPSAVGALTPSSAELARRIAVPVSLSGQPVVVELGPGTGVFTHSIQRRLAGRGRHLAIEINPRFARQLAGRFPAVDVVCGDAADLGALLADRGMSDVDAVVSGLPWALMPQSRQHRLLDAIVGVLSPSGVFSTFAYLHALGTPGARRLRRSLEARFEEAIRERAVWRNMPPAAVYHCRRGLRLPRTPAPGQLVHPSTVMAG